MAINRVKRLNTKLANKLANTIPATTVKAKAFSFTLSIILPANIIVNPLKSVAAA